MNKSIIRFSIDLKSEKIVLAVSILIYLILGLSIIQNYLFILNTDGISYIHIAQYYVNGLFSSAINGYWSPMYSWLLIPFFMLWQGKLEILYSLKLLGLLIGCFTFLGVFLLADKLNLNIKLKTAAMIILIPNILYFAFYKTTPDLLVLTILIFYLNIMLNEKYLKNLRMGLLAGFLGAMAFLSKSYVFFFFIVHFIIVNTDYWLNFKKNRRIITKNCILGLIIFLCISGIWVAIISDKYNKFTIGTSGTYNHDVFGPENQGHPNYFQGLMKPYDEYALSIWDDPSYTKVEGWSPFSSPKNFYYQLQIASNNILETLKIFESFSVLSILIIVMAIFLIFKSSNKSYKNKLRLIVLTIFIYSAGYCIIFVETRYLWFIDILLILLGLFVVKILTEENSVNKTFSIIFIFLLSCSFMLYPIFNLYDISGDGKDIYKIAENLKKYDIQGSNIAASSADWRDSLILSYYLNTRYYGLTKLNSSEKEISEELHRNNIKYYIWWRKESIDIPGYEKLIDPGFSYPTVYKQI